MEAVKVTDERMVRIAVVTVGRSPRPDVLAELTRRLGPVQCDEFATFDDVDDTVMHATPPRAGEPPFFVRLSDSDHVVVPVPFVEKHVARLVARIDQLGYDLIVVAATALFAPLKAHTPIVHGQHAVDAWVSALVVGDVNIGLIYPLTQQDRQLTTFEHSVQFRGAHASLQGGYGTHLPDAATAVAAADLIVMHSVGYTEAMAQGVARETGKPVVTARRIVAAAVQLRLTEIMGRSAAATQESYTGSELLRRLPDVDVILTPREQEVLALALEGGSNKMIGRALGISHRTVEIHRGRGMAKLGTASIPELIRKALTSG